MLHYRNNLGGSYKFVITSNYTCIYTSAADRWPREYFNRESKGSAVSNQQVQVDSKDDHRGKETVT